MDVSTLQNIPSSQIVDSTSSKSLSAPVDIDLIGPSPSTSDYPDAEIAHPVLNQSKIPGASTNQPGSGSKRSKKMKAFKSMDTLSEEDNAGAAQLLLKYHLNTILIAFEVIQSKLREASHNRKLERDRIYQAA